MLVQQNNYFEGQIYSFQLSPLLSWTWILKQPFYCSNVTAFLSYDITDFDDIGFARVHVFLRNAGEFVPKKLREFEIVNVGIGRRGGGVENGKDSHSYQSSYRHLTSNSKLKTEKSIDGSESTRL
jgi:hypothetical protein